jgi:diguanylate cyclase (GGDEF)-like protein
MESPVLARELDAARSVYWEDPAGSLATAIRVQEAARALGEHGLHSRALALQGAITLHRGDLGGAFALAADAERHAEIDGCDAARSEVAGLKGHLAFFSGSYADALRNAELALACADRTGDLDLRIFARRAACMVFGNVGVEDWPEQLQEVLALSIEADDGWQEAISRNDLACLAQHEGRAAEAAAEIERGIAVAHALPGRNGFALGVLHSTRADIGLLCGRPGDALADAERAIAHMTANGDPNPYVFGVTVRAHVQALMALGRLDDARATGEGALSRLGDRVPQARSLILSTIADALRDAGHVEAAYEALSRSAELERQAFRELSQLQLQLERATLETGIVRLEAELLRDQADRDWLTGLHNRRYLARELDRLTGESPEGPFSVAVLDLDHFKSINDRFGHEAGDRVLVRVAALLLDGLRQSDVVVRTGGEEFVVLMPRTAANAAAACCERLRTAIATERWEEIGPGLEVTASVGLASSADNSGLDALASLADDRLFAAKRAGRDRVVAA